MWETCLESGFAYNVALAELRVFVGAAFVPNTRLLHYRFTVGFDDLKGLFQPK